MNNEKEKTKEKEPETKEKKELPCPKARHITLGDKSVVIGDFNSDRTFYQANGYRNWPYG